MSLVLEIEFLTGVCRASREQSDEVPDWPPQPDRVFSALVSAWAARGECPEERVALEWLEVQPSPTIHASDHTSRTAPMVYVPTNDQKASKSVKTYAKVMPNQRPRQPRRFPVARPDDPSITLTWPEEPESNLFEALNKISHCVGYLGHSASLVRCQFHLDMTPSQRISRRNARRRIYPGRMSELEDAHRVNPIRPKIRPGAPVFIEQTPDLNSLDEGWLVLKVISDAVPDIRSAAIVCRILRKALMSGYRKAGLGNAIDEVVSGHTPEGFPTRHPHLAIVPMAFVGFPHADGNVLGFSIIPPTGTMLRKIKGFRDAFEKVAHYRQNEDQRVLTLQGPPLIEPLHLAPVAGGGEQKFSLSPQPYIGPSRIWASTTPVVLERHLKRRDETEVRELVASACENAGLPRPPLKQIQVDKHSMVDGVPPSQPLTGEPPWLRWRTPKSLASRQLVHAIIDFGIEVHGPVLLGAGRFTGLGLCRSMGA